MALTMGERDAHGVILSQEMLTMDESTAPGVPRRSPITEHMIQEHTGQHDGIWLVSRLHGSLAGITERHMYETGSCNFDVQVAHVNFGFQVPVGIVFPYPSVPMHDSSSI